jgi:hypothetical protein
VKQYDIDDDDLAGIDPTGQRGEILLKDLADMIKEIKANSK